MNEQMDAALDKSKQTLKKLLYRRAGFIVLLILLQLVFLVASFFWLSQYTSLLWAGSTVLSIVVVIYLLNSSSNPAFKITWILLLTCVPVLGGLFYLFIQANFGVRALRKLSAEEIRKSRGLLHTKEETAQALLAENPAVRNLSRYIEAHGGCATFDHSGVTYFPLGEDKFSEMLSQLKQAKKFIFLEYFIVDEGKMWDSILEILEQKVAEGVEVRVMYDGFGCMMTLPPEYYQLMQRKGIRAKVFNPVKPFLSTSQNYRDHRKILVIDGQVAFNGGINLADEYINEIERFGHWKDTAIMVTGEAVRSYTLMFLQMWNVGERQPESYAHYLAAFTPMPDAPGFVIPYADSPVDEERVGETVYLDLLYHATDYIHIMTPYLIITNEMLTALCTAAKSGVDVKLILPHIPDKWYAFVVARSFYPTLISAGVKIYEYTPGFVHAKVFVSDDKKATVGTINLDYRSLYHHFECGAYLYQTQAIADIEADFQATLKKCQKIDLQTYKNFKVFDKIAGKVLKVFAPLL